MLDNQIALVQKLIGSNICEDRAYWIAVHVKVVESEYTEVLEQEDQSRHEVELKKELYHLCKRLNLYESKCHC